MRWRVICTKVSIHRVNKTGLLLQLVETFPTYERNRFWIKSMTPDRPDCTREERKGVSIESVLLNVGFKRLLPNIWLQEN